MKQKASYGMRIKDLNGQLQSHLKRSLEEYTECLAATIIIVFQHWGDIEKLEKQKEKHNEVEKFIHSTKGNTAEHPEWDEKHPNYPSYLRRATIMDAIGCVQSYKSNHQRWADGGKKGEEPTLGNMKHPSPTFYNSDMFKWDYNSSTAKIKLMKQNGKWTWFDIEFEKTDVDYIRKHCQDRTPSAPSLVKRGKAFDLVVLWTYDVDLVKKPASQKIATIVDLGVNTSAACMAMDAHGNVIARKTFKYKSEERKLDHFLNIIKKRQQHGSKNMKGSWKDADDMNRHISEMTVRNIVDFAENSKSDVLVFEYLDMTGKIRGKSRRQRLAIWRYRAVQKGAEQKGHDKGIRFARVNSWGSSSMAHDGSGKCKRGSKIEDSECSHGYGVVQLPDGSLYSSEYNATMNLGARYFLRELLRELPKRRREAIVKRLPQLEKPGSCVYADLIEFWRVHDELTAAAEKRRKKKPVK